MDRLVLFVLLMALGAVGGLGWDRHPPLPFPLSWAGPSLAQERDQARSDLAIQAGNVKALQGALDGQNASIRKLDEDSARDLAASRKAQADAAALAANYRRRAVDILAAKPEGDDLCVAADKLIRETVQ